MSLNAIKEIERAIGALTPREIEELYVWLEQHCPPPIDARVQADLAAGRPRHGHPARPGRRERRTRTVALAPYAASRRHPFLAAIPRPFAGSPRPRRQTVFIA